MQNSDVFEKDRKYIAHTYHRFPAAIKTGHGAQAENYEGKKYIDFGSGIGTNMVQLLEVIRWFVLVRLKC